MEHLSATMEWLCTGQDITGCGGVSTAYDKRIGLTFTVLTGTGRVLADKHHWWDVLVGAGVGWVTGAGSGVDV